VAEPPPAQQQRGFILDTLSKFLEWLDSPWKAFALVGIAIVGGLGYGGWMSRDTLVDVWKMTSGRPILKRSEMPAMMTHLRQEAKADVVAIWSLNLSANAMNFELGFQRYDEKWVFSPKRIPAIRDPISEPRGLSEIMAGMIVCRTPAKEANGDLFLRAMREAKIRHYCLVPVPPAPNILVAIMIIGWIEDPDAQSEEAALGLARETAATMVSRWE
jgi:hypothetical protein